MQAHQVGTEEAHQRSGLETGKVQRIQKKFISAQARVSDPDPYPDPDPHGSALI